MNGRVQHYNDDPGGMTERTLSKAPENHDFETSSTDNGFALFKEYSTFHGVKDLCKANYFPTRCLWAFILCASIFFSIQGCYMIINEFIERPVVVSYFVADGGAQLALPDIIICPFNRFNRTYLEHLNIKGDMAQYLELAFPGPNMFDFQISHMQRVRENMAELDANFTKILNSIGNMSFNDFMHHASLDCRAFFQDSHLCDNATELMTSVGKCYRLSGGEQFSDGFGYGQRLLITLPKHLYNSGANQMLNDGIVVKLAEPGHGVDHDLTFISSGVHAIMPLAATQYEFMNDPPRYSCVDDSAKNYSRLWCFEYCLTKKAEDTCNCSLIAAANRRKAQICTTFQALNCFYPSMFADDTAAKQAFQHCRSECKAPCKYWKYSKTISTANLSPESALAFVQNESVAAELRNMIILEVFYTTFDYTVIKHMLAMTPSSFIAQLGGQVSLWIGGSIVSVVQVFVYICCGSYAHFYNTYCKRPKEKADNGCDKSFQTIPRVYSSEDERLSDETRI